MTRTGVISDDLWQVIEPVLPSGAGLRGRPWREHRQVLEAIAWRYRTGTPWRDLPNEFGPWQTVWKRHRRWSFDGTYELMFLALRDAENTDDERDSVDLDAELAELLSVDSTIVRAHQHAAGARFDCHTGG